MIYFQTPLNVNLLQVFKQGREATLMKVCFAGLRSARSVSLRRLGPRSILALFMAMANLQEANPLRLRGRFGLRPRRIVGLGLGPFASFKRRLRPSASQVRGRSLWHTPRK